MSSQSSETIYYSYGRVIRLEINILIGSTEKGGICSVILGDDLEVMERELFATFPSSSFTKMMLGNTFDQVVKHIIDPRYKSVLPLDIRGTEFQKLVWEGIRKIPVGRTVSYTELAESIGRPSSVRAVASACGANKLAVIIPCHRVLPASGDTGKYKWGTKLKDKLLDREESMNEQ